MECLRCGATIKDNAVVCNKCGFIVKGAKKLEVNEPTKTFEERVNEASVEELRAILLAMKAKQDAKLNPKKKEELAPEVRAAKSGKKWATASLICGILSLVLIVVPGVNVILALLLFILAFMGFGKSNGHKINMAMVGLIMTIIAIAGSWLYNAYFAATVGQMLGLAPATEQTDGSIDEGGVYVENTDSSSTDASGETVA